jgi:hypothetical protein
MAAIAIDDTPSAANWAKAKPKDYKNGALDKALATYEAALKKPAPEFKVPADVKLSAYETFVKDVTTLIATLKERQTALAGVASAGSACEAELRKELEKREGDEWKAYSYAASVAGAIASNAASMGRKHD